jgi:radical SAM superfamily enzyme YgiQ (UPF0313 family)
VKVVLGGMHVSQLPEEAMKECDAVVIGEAEGLWQRVLFDFENQSLQTVYRHEQGLPSLDALPSPDWSLYRDKKYLPVHFIETTRGCPLDCEFCSVTNAFGGKYRNRPQAEVIAELRQRRPFDGVLTLKNCVFFVDDNIISNRAYARTFLPQIAEFNLKWFGQASVNIAHDPEILELCRKSGCMGLFIGFESLSRKTLEAMGKRVNKPDEYLEVVKRIHDHGIGIDGSFVFGFDTDDEGVFERTVSFAKTARLDAAYFSILTPYPGTRLYNRLLEENRLLSTDWSLYDSSHVVYKPKQMTEERLLAGFHASLGDFYSFSSIFSRLWGLKTYKNFFYPMNFGFKASAAKLLKQSRASASTG